MRTEPEVILRALPGWNNPARDCRLSHEGDETIRRNRFWKHAENPIRILPHNRCVITPCEKNNRRWAVHSGKYAVAVENWHGEIEHDCVEPGHLQGFQGKKAVRCFRHFEPCCPEDGGKGRPHCVRVVHEQYVQLRRRVRGAVDRSREGAL